MRIYRVDRSGGRRATRAAGYIVRDDEGRVLARTYIRHFDAAARAEMIARDCEPRARIPTFDEFGQVRSMLARSAALTLARSALARKER